MTKRNCIDSSDTIWEVFEVYPGTERRTADRVPPAFRDGWLCFQSFTERRRLAPIPPGWDEWDDAALMAASLKGLKTPRRTPPGMRV
jgi:hypothetical protein